MNNQEKHLLNQYLRLDYYKKDITDMHSLITTNVVLDNDVLNNIKDKLYITTFDKYIKLQQENKELKDNWNELREYFNERIEVCDNRLSSPFCNFEKATKERLIFSQCLEKLEELKQGSDSNVKD